MACDCYCHRLRSRVVSSRAISCMAYKTLETDQAPSCHICIDGDPISVRDATLRKNVNVRSIDDITTLEVF